MTKLTAKKKLIYSVVILVFALIVTVSVVFGWFSMNNNTNNDFIVTVTDISASVSLRINNVDHNGSSLALENAMPLSEYIFEITVLASSDGMVRISFVNAEGSFFDEEYDLNGDMCDIMAIKYPFDSQTYTPVSELQNNVILSGAPIAANTPTVVKFTLFFSNVPPEGVDINIYQNKTFTVEKLKIEIY